MRRYGSGRLLGMTETVPSADQSTPEQEQWLTPGVRGIGTASFLADVGHEIPTALLPSLLTSTLGAPAAALGAIEGFSDALAGAARFGGGVLADDPARRRKVAVGGYATTAVLGAATAGATAVWQVGVLRAAAWTARGLRVPARNALISSKDLSRMPQVPTVAGPGQSWGWVAPLDEDERRGLGSLWGRSHRPAEWGGGCGTALGGRRAQLHGDDEAHDDGGRGRRYPGGRSQQPGPPPWRRMPPPAGASRRAGRRGSGVSSGPPPYLLSSHRNHPLDPLRRPGSAKRSLFGLHTVRLEQRAAGTVPDRSATHGTTSLKPTTGVGSRPVLRTPAVSRPDTPWRRRRRRFSSATSCKGRGWPATVLPQGVSVSVLRGRGDADTRLTRRDKPGLSGTPLSVAQ